MKAARYHEHGGPEKILYEDAPDPEPGEGEALVRVRAAALNHLDLWVLQGIPAYKVPLPHIPGTDGSGEVAKLGPSPSSPPFHALQVGQKVVIQPGLYCGECAYCKSGRENQCEDFHILGARTPGTFAEFVRVPAKNLYPMPENLSFEQAAAFPLTFLTAWHMLVTRAGIHEGENVLVLGAGSGVGVAAIQIAKQAGCRVLAVAGSDEKCAKAKELGADDACNYTREDFNRRAIAFTKGKGMDIVFEHVGPATWKKSLESLGRCGRIVTCGATSGPEVSFDVRYLFSRDLSVLGSRMGTLQEFRALLRLVGEGKLKPVVDTVFPLSEARAAFEKMSSRSLFGKLVLKIS